MSTDPRVHGWRKIAGSSWRAPVDPQFYGDLEVDAGALLDYMAEVRRHTGVHLTPTHLTARAVAHALSLHPEVNGHVAHGRFVARSSVDVFVQVALDEGRDLTGVKMVGVDRTSAVDLARDLAARTQVLARGEDPELGRTKALFERLGQRTLAAGLRLTAWLSLDHGVDLTRFGVPHDPFGSAMVTSVGMWGIARAYAPLAAYYRVPFLLLVGAVQPRAVVVAGTVLARPMLTVTGTFDHRCVDGWHAARLGDAVRDYLAHPARFEPPLPAAAVDLTSADERPRSPST